MAVTNLIRTRSAEGRTQVVYGKLTFSGNYPAGGELLGHLGLGTQKPPLRWTITGSSQTNLYAYDDVNKKVIVRTAAGVEITAGAYPAGVTSDTVEYDIVYPRF